MIRTFAIVMVLSWGVFSFSGCTTIMLGYAGVAVTSATVDEYIDSKTNSTGTEDVDEYLAEQRRISKAFAECPAGEKRMLSNHAEPFIVPDINPELE